MTMCGLHAFPLTGLEGQYAGTVDSALAGPHRPESEGKCREHEALEELKLLCLWLLAW